VVVEDRRDQEKIYCTGWRCHPKWLNIPYGKVEVKILALWLRKVR
jgi:hypothetical protein